MALMGFGGLDDMFGNMDRMMNSMMRTMMGGMSADPFQMMDSMMGNQRQMMPNPMNMMMSNISTIPCSSYSYSSQVISYSSDGSGRPQVYEATSSTHLGPNGVKETQSSVRDSRTGRQEMTIGRHIRDRGHVMSKKRNVYTGDEEDDNEYINIEEEEAHNFHREFSHQMSSSRARHGNAAITHGRRPQPLAIQAGPSSSSLHHHQQQPQQLHHHHSQHYNHPSQSRSNAHTSAVDYNQYQSVPSPNCGAAKKMKKSKKDRKPYQKTNNQ